jgi:hypothetical protein
MVPRCKSTVNLTGPDDAAFCHRVPEALNEGWLLFGPPTLTFDTKIGRVICGQAITKRRSRSHIFARYGSVVGVRCLISTPLCEG